MSPKVVALVSSGRYKQEHYEDVARLLVARMPKDNVQMLVQGLDKVALDFADLFAADNPPACIDCGAHRGEADPEGECLRHLFAGAFDREKFLTACGLATEAKHGL